MTSEPRVILVILDGLRPDAVEPSIMPSLARIASSGRFLRGTTVTPSVTVAALGSLVTGVSPAAHGIREGALPPLTRLHRLRPLPQVLRAHRRSTHVVASQVRTSAAIIARSLLGLAGLGRLTTAGATPASVGDALLRASLRHPADLTVAYLNDCDVAGHRDGWMSPSYLAAARAVDAAVGPCLGAAEALGALLLVTADHGGGGIDPRDHDAPHPLNAAIPIIAAGPALHASAPPSAAPHLLDLPPTILDALHLPIPPQYEGRSLSLTSRIAAAA